MTAANFNRAGAIDLSGLANRAATDSNTASSAGGLGSYVMEVTEASFDRVASLSMQHPVLLELTMGSAQETKPVDDALIELTNAAAGRWLLARVDVDNEPRIAQALGVQAVPTVLALIGGQVAPLFQGTRDKADISALLDQVVHAAVANGITGRAQPVTGGAAVHSGEEPAEPAADPRFAAADEALARGDFVAAGTEFDKLLQANPRDSEAAAGKAQVGLLLRTEGGDASSLLAAADGQPGNVAAQLAAADVEVMSGLTEAGFARLIELIRNLTGAEKDEVRLRLLELFNTQEPNDPTVLKARRDLSSALY